MCFVSPPVVQRACVMVPQTAFCFSNLHAQRLRDEGLRGTVTKLPGEYEGPTEIVPGEHVEPLVLFAGRHIPEKRVPAIPPAIRQSREVISNLRGLILGDGPERERVLTQIAEMGLTEAVEVPGFVDTEVVEEAMLRAMCLLLPFAAGRLRARPGGRGSRNPSIVVTGPDNAAVELITEGANGFIAASDSQEDLAAAIWGGGAGRSGST